MSPAEIEKVLTKKGFQFNRDLSEGAFAMSRKRGYLTVVAMVEADGTVNGLPLDEFLAAL